MFDLFGKKRRQELFDSAYGEFVSGNYALSEKKLTQLIEAGVKDFNVRNLRAQTYLESNMLDLAYQDSIISVQLEPNIEQNKTGYDIRNFITNQLKSGAIKVDIFELINFFGINNVVQLYCELALLSFDHELDKWKSQIPGSKVNLKNRLTFIALNYLKWQTKHQIARPEKTSYKTSRLNELLVSIKSLNDRNYLQTISSSLNLMSFHKLEISLKIDEHHLWVSYTNRKEIDTLREYILDQFDPTKDFDNIILNFLNSLQFDIIRNPFHLQNK